MRKALVLKDLYDEAYETDHLEPLLSPQRKDFLDAAVLRSDFKAVLDTTPPCQAG